MNLVEPRLKAQALLHYQVCKVWFEVQQYVPAITGPLPLIPLPHLYLMAVPPYHGSWGVLSFFSFSRWQHSSLDNAVVGM